jgi:hypothetical protein
MLAIGAACIAYRGAVRQSKAPLLAADQVRAFNRQAAAASFWAELSHCRRQLIGDVKVLNSLRGIVSHNIERLSLTPPSTEIFDSNPAAVGLLPSDEAFAVTHAYKTVKAVAHLYQVAGDRLANPDIRERALSAISTQASHAAEVIDEVLRDFRGTAGISDEQAAEVN